MNEIINSISGIYKKSSDLSLLNYIINLFVVALMGFLAFLTVVVAANFFSFIFGYIDSFTLESLDFQISILGAGLQLSIFLLKKAEKKDEDQ